MAREWEKRESSKLKELERRTEQMLAKFDEQAQQTIDQIVHGAEQRKAAEQAQRRVAKTKRELREEFQTTVLSTQDDRATAICRGPRSRKARGCGCRAFASRRACGACWPATGWKWKPDS
jgi:exonuclease VII large subunit